MEKKNGPGDKLWAMEGKGFYIVLFLCAAVIGASAWILLADAGTDVEEVRTADSVAAISDVVVTMLPAGTPMDTPEPAAESLLEEDVSEQEAAAEEEDYAAAPTFTETVTTYVWPVQGGVEVSYAMETLLYDATMADWRTHDGIDIACDLGDEVLAAAGGLVTGVREDDLYGTVVEIDHKNGVHSIYANLASEPLVHEGDTVSIGQTIGSVGRTALAETNVVPHLHFAMTLDGASADPREYLPERLGE